MKFLLKFSFSKKFPNPNKTQNTIFLQYLDICGKSKISKNFRFLAIFIFTIGKKILLVANNLPNYLPLVKNIRILELALI